MASVLVCVKQHQMAAERRCLYGHRTDTTGASPKRLCWRGAVTILKTCKIIGADPDFPPDSTQIGVDPDFPPDSMQILPDLRGVQDST
jgi:hypothetical protein